MHFSELVIDLYLKLSYINIFMNNMGNIMSRGYLLLFCAFISKTAIVHGASDNLAIPEMTELSKSDLEGMTAAGLFCVDALMNTKKVRSNEYSNETEQSLKDRGYNERLIEGLDHVNANLRLAQSLRDRWRDESIDLNTLHIPAFADQIDLHVKFIEGIIRSQSSNDKVERLELLEELKAEAQHRKSSESVTYRYFFSLNLRLSILATPAGERYKKAAYEPRFDNSEHFQKWMRDTSGFRKWIIDDSELESDYAIIQGINNRYVDFNSQDQGEVLDAIRKGVARLTPYERSKVERFLYLINVMFDDTEYEAFKFVNLLHDFPRRIMIPTIYDLGIMSINRTYGTGVHLIGLSKKSYGSYFSGDFNYVFFLRNINESIMMDIDNSQMVTHFQSMLAGLTPLQRENVEIAYFGATYLSERSLEDFPIDFSLVEYEILKMYGHKVNEQMLDEGERIFIYLLISSWIKERGMVKTIVLVNEYLDEHPELKEEILEILNE